MIFIVFSGSFFYFKCKTQDYIIDLAYLSQNFNVKGFYVHKNITFCAFGIQIGNSVHKNTTMFNETPE